MSEPVIPEPPSFESQYCSYGDCGYVECEKSFLLAKLGAAEAKVAEQAATIERLTGVLRQCQPILWHFAALNPKFYSMGGTEQDPRGVHGLMPRIHAALSKQEPR